MQKGIIARFGGVIVWTENFAQMRSFYVDTLGLEPRSDREGFVNFAWGEVRLSIAEHSEVRGRSRDPLRVMINLLVEDIEKSSRRLREAGVSFSRLPEREKWGGWVATFADPDGNTLQLLQPDSE